MSDLMIFYEEFKKQGFGGNHLVQDAHTLKLCVDSSSIFSSVLRYVVKNCPDSCSFYVSYSDKLYLCVYDD